MAPLLQQSLKGRVSRETSGPAGYAQRADRVRLSGHSVAVCPRRMPGAYDTPGTNPQSYPQEDRHVIHRSIHRVLGVRPSEQRAVLSILPVHRCRACVPLQRGQREICPQDKGSVASTENLSGHAGPRRTPPSEEAHTPARELARRSLDPCSRRHGRACGAERRSARPGSALLRRGTRTSGSPFLAVPEACEEVGIPGTLPDSQTGAIRILPPEDSFSRGTRHRSGLAQSQWSAAMTLPF